MNLRQRDREVLPETGQVSELEIDDLDLVLAQQFDNLLQLDEPRGASRRR